VSAAATLVKHNRSAVTTPVNDRPAGGEPVPGVDVTAAGEIAHAGLEIGGSAGEGQRLVAQNVPGGLEASQLDTKAAANLDHDPRARAVEGHFGIGPGGADAGQGPALLNRQLQGIHKSDCRQAS
jgi:hypothetical protein